MTCINAAYKFNNQINQRSEIMKSPKKHITFRVELDQLRTINKIIHRSRGRIETLSHFLRLAVSEKIDRERGNK